MNPEEATSLINSSNIHLTHALDLGIRSNIYIWFSVNMDIYI